MEWFPTKKIQKTVFYIHLKSPFCQIEGQGWNACKGFLNVPRSRKSMTEVKSDGVSSDGVSSDGVSSDGVSSDGLSNITCITMNTK